MRAISWTFKEAQENFDVYPLYKILAFDPTLDSISSVAVGTYTQTPLDVTDYCTNILWSHEKFSFVLADTDGIFHPDTGAMRNYFKDKAIIRLLEGDKRIPENEWIPIFTGQIHGQIGWKISRTEKILESNITVYSRENSKLFQRKKITTNAYTIGTDIGVMLVEVCTSHAGLNIEEFRLPTVLGFQLEHMINQLSEVTPWEAIQIILETVGKVPYFDGEGKLAYYSKDMSRLPSKIFTDTKDIFDYVIPENMGDGINKVRIIFLSSTLSKITNQSQSLGTASVTTGFFTGREELECWWSEDRKQRAENTTMVTLKGINDNLIPGIGTEDYSQIDEFHGKITITISIWVPILATVLLIAYIGFAAIPDGVITGGVFVSGGVTIPIGRIIQAAALIGILILMMSLGSAQYEIWGVPYDYVYREMESIAVEDGLAVWEEEELRIENSLFSNFEEADIIAVTELIWERCKSYPRRLTIRNDVSLEVGDIVLSPDGRKFMVHGLSKSIKKGESTNLVLDCYKVLTV